MKLAWIAKPREIRFPLFASRSTMSSSSGGGGAQARYTEHDMRFLLKLQQRLGDNVCNTLVYYLQGTTPHALVVTRAWVYSCCAFMQLCAKILSIAAIFFLSSLCAQVARALLLVRLRCVSNLSPRQDLVDLCVCMTGRRVMIVVIRALAMHTPCNPACLSQPL